MSRVKTFDHGGKVHGDRSHDFPAKKRPPKRDVYRCEVSYTNATTHTVGLVRTGRRQATIFIETFKSSDPEGRELDRFLRTLKFEALKKGKKRC